VEHEYRHFDPGRNVLIHTFKIRATEELGQNTITIGNLAGWKRMFAVSGPNTGTSKILEAGQSIDFKLAEIPQGISEIQLYIFNAVQDDDLKQFSDPSPFPLIVPTPFDYDIHFMGVAGSLKTLEELARIQETN
jgi:hypothetical protein